MNFGQGINSAQGSNQQRPNSFFQQNASFQGGNSASPFGRPSTPNQSMGGSFFANAPTTMISGSGRGSQQQVSRGNSQRGGGAMHQQRGRGNRGRGQQMMAPAANLSMGASGFAQRGGATVNRGNGFIRGGGRGYTPQNMQSQRSLSQTPFQTTQVPSIVPPFNQINQRGRGNNHNQQSRGGFRGGRGRGSASRQTNPQVAPQGQSFADLLKNTTQVLSNPPRSQMSRAQSSHMQANYDVDMSNNASMSSTSSLGRGQRQPPTFLNKNHSQNSQSSNNRRNEQPPQNLRMSQSQGSITRNLSQSSSGQSQQNSSFGRIPQAIQKPQTLPQRQQVQNFQRASPLSAKPPVSDPKKPPQAAQPKAPLRGKQQDDEEEEANFEDEYYDDEEEGEVYYDEEYDEEGELEQEEPDNKVASPIPSREKEAGLKTPITKTVPKQVSPLGIAENAKVPQLGEIIGMIKIFKTSFQGAENICEFFLSNTCTFGATCKKSHDKNIKAEFEKIIAPIKAQYGLNNKPDEVKEAPKPDLRSTVLGKQVREPISSAFSREQPQTLPARPSQEETKQVVSQSQPVKKSLGKTLSAKKDPIVMPERKRQIEEEILMPVRVQQPIIQRLPSSTTTRTVALIKQKQAQFIQEFQALKQERQKHIIPGKAECVGMCPDQEIVQRGEIEVSSVDGFELDNYGKYFDFLSIKKYSRSAADKVMSDPPMVRPPELLYKTVEYLRECIVDLDRITDPAPYKKSSPSFGDMYSFVRDRFKSITQDFGIVDMSQNQYQIMAMEEICRFMICSTHDGFTEDHFDMKQHMDIINSNLTALKKSYDFIRFLYPNEKDPYRVQCLKNEAEFLTYWILNFPDNPVVTAGIINQLEVSKLFKDEKSQQLVREAIKISAFISNEHTQEYFKYFRTTQNYMLACFLLKFLNQMRRQMVNQLINARARMPNALMQKNLRVSDLQEKLFFYDEEEVLSFAECCGFVSFVNLPDGETAFNSVDRIIDREQDEKFKSYQQKTPLLVLDRLRGDQSRCQLIQTPLQVSFQPTITRNLIGQIQGPKLVATIPMQTYVAPKVPSLSSGLSTATLPFGSFPAQPSNPNQTSLFNQKPPAIVSVELSKPSSFASIPASSISDTIFKPAPKPTTEPILDKPPPFAASNIGNSFSTAIDPEKAKRDKEAEKQKEAMRKKKEEEERVQKQLEKDIEWGDHNDKFTRWSNWKMTNFKQQMLLGFKQLLHSKKQFLRMIPSSLSQSVEDEAVQEFAEESLSLIKDKAVQQRVAMTYTEIELNQRKALKSKVIQFPWGPGTFDMSLMANQILQNERNQTGVLRVKLFYHKANKESSPTQDVLETLESDIFAKLKQSTTEQVSCIFKAQEFPMHKAEIETPQAKAEGVRHRSEELMQQFMGSNLIVVFSSIKSLLGDIKKMKEAFAFCPEHTCFALLWILHKNGEKINIGEQTIHKDFEQELRLKKISFLSVSSVYSKSPAPKLQQVTKRTKGPSPQKLSIKNAVLAFILPELQNSLNNVQIYPSAKKSQGEIKLTQLSIQLEEKLGEILKMVQHSNEQKAVALEMRKLAKRCKPIYDNEALSSEVNIANFLILVTKEYLKQIQKDMIDSIRQIAQQIKFTQFNIDLIKKIMGQHKQIERFISTQLIIAPSDFASQEGQAYFKRKIEQWLKTLYADDTVINPILSQTKQLHTYSGKLHELKGKDLLHFRGALLFSFLLHPFFTILFSNDTAYFLNTTSDSIRLDQMLPQLQDASKKIAQKEKQMEKLRQERLQLEQKELLQPAVNQRKRLQKMSECDRLNEEVKQMMDPMGVEIKRKEAVARQRIELAKTLEEADQRVRERLNKAQEDESSAVQGLKPLHRRPVAKMAEEAEERLKKEEEDLKSDLEFLEKIKNKKRARR